MHFDQNELQFRAMQRGRYAIADRVSCRCNVLLFTALEIVKCLKIESACGNWLNVVIIIIMWFR